MEQEQERIVKGIWIPIGIWKDTNLTWNEKILLLEIDSFTSQDKDCYFSDEYISELLSISITNANKTLASLIKKGYVIKTKFDGRRRYVKSALSQTTDLLCQERQTSHAGANDTSNDSSLINKPTKEENNKKKERQTIEYPQDFTDAFVATGRKGSKKNAYKRWQALSDEDKLKVVKHIKFYYKSNDRQYLKDFEGYLNGRYFENVVYDKNGNVMYDPDRESSNEYVPQTSYSLMWSDEYKCYIYVGMFLSMLADGYTDEDRPNGARIMLNNARGFVVWNSKTKMWEKTE